MLYIIDYGSQYTGLITKFLDQSSISNQVISPPEFIPILEQDLPIMGLIISGSPKTISIEDVQWGHQIFPALHRRQIPTLGICFGFQLIAQHFGSKLIEKTNREYGKTKVHLTTIDHPIFSQVTPQITAWMSHGNSITISPLLEVLAHSQDTIVAFQVKNHNIFATLYHPEVTHTEDGEIVLKNFIQNICLQKIQTIENDWKVFESKIEIKFKKIPKVLCAVSGGVDSTVLAVLLSKYCEVHAIYVDHGFQRNYDLKDLKEIFKNFPNIHLHVVNAKEVFLEKLKKIIDPEEKRKIIGQTFIETFTPYAKNLNITFFAQGTIASDVVESGSNASNTAQKIKSHHNVGALPKELPFTLIEPLRELFKDQVRALGIHLNIPEQFIRRHPFPGPGLSIRCLGEITFDRMEKLKKADDIFYHELKSRNLYDGAWQAGVILLPIRSTGVMGDGNSYEECLAIRMVNSIDAMTADVCEIPWNDLKEISNCIINQVEGINRVVYDITSKPPATIEWE